MSQSIRLSSSLLARSARSSVRISRRTFVVSTLRNADAIQEMYLKELRGYKPPPVKPNDSEGHVQKFTPPKVPKSPEETDLASEMKAYEDQVVEIEGQAAAGEAHEPHDDYFEDIRLIEEEEKHGASAGAH